MQLNTKTPKIVIDEIITASGIIVSSSTNLLETLNEYYPKTEDSLRN